MENPFIVKDCALIAIATGLRAQNLPELRNRIQEIPQACLYYHFWGGLLRSKFDDPEFPNDFAYWARHSLQDKILAERDPAKLPWKNSSRMLITREDPKTIMSGRRYFHISNLYLKRLPFNAEP